jgi:hypothetical protein
MGGHVLFTRVSFCFTISTKEKHQLALPQKDGLRDARGLAISQPIDLAAVGDIENSAPTAWWLYPGQSHNDIIQEVKTLNACIIDISPDNSSGT